MSTNDIAHAPPKELVVHAEAFVGWIRGRTPIGEDPVARAALGPFVADSPRMRAADQIEAYRIQYFGRLASSLGADFAALRAHLTVSVFEALVRDFIDASPPPDGNLYRYGAALPAFLAGRPEGTPLAVDLARLDWAFCDGHDAPDAPPLTVEALAAIPPEELGDARLAVQPALRLVRLGHRLGDARLALRGGEDPGPIREETTYVVVARDDAGSLEFLETSAPAFCTLARLQAGEPLGAALEGAAEDAGATEEEMLAQLSGWFQRWTAWGWLVGP